MLNKEVSVTVTYYKLATESMCTPNDINEIVTVAEGKAESSGEVRPMLGEEALLNESA